MASSAPSDAQQQGQIERLLAAARDTVAAVPFCWVVTAADDRGAHARSSRRSRATRARSSGRAGF